jgi:hypothetical protein
MRHEWLIVAGFGAIYTWLAFLVPLGDDFPPLWSNKDPNLRWKIILVHTLFLAAYLGVFGWLTWRESSFAWLARSPRGWHTGAADLIVAGIFTAMLERLLFSRGPEPGDADKDGDGNDKS